MAKLEAEADFISDYVIAGRSALSMRLCHIYSLDELYQNARMFVEGINYKLFSMALIYVDDIIDDDISHLSPKYDVSRDEISRHFIAKLKRE